VVAVVPKKKLYHPWLRYHCICVTTSTKKAVKELKNYFEIKEVKQNKL